MMCCFSELNSIVIACEIILLLTSAHCRFPDGHCMKYEFLICMQRPLKTIAKRSSDVYIPRGVSVPPLDKDILWDFQPKKLGNVLFSIYIIYFI